MIPLFLRPFVTGVPNTPAVIRTLPIVRTTGTPYTIAQAQAFRPRFAATQERAYLLWEASDRSQSEAWYWAQAEHGLRPLGHCPECQANGRKAHTKAV